MHSHMQSRWYKSQFTEPKDSKFTVQV